MKTGPKDPINYIKEMGMSGCYSLGLTKREYFAALALQGIASSPDTDISDPMYIASMAAILADQLILALNKQEGES